MATYLSTVDNLLLSDIFTVCATTGQRTGVILNTGEYVPVAKVDSHDLQRSVSSGTIYRAVNQGWITAGTNLTSSTIVLNSGVKIVTGGVTVTIGGTGTTTFTVTVI
jgi:hypothetical protein